MDVVWALVRRFLAALCVAAALSVVSHSQTASDVSPVGPAASAVVERLQLGREAMVRRAFSEARDHFFRVLQLDWNNPQAYAWWCAAKDSVAEQLCQMVATGDRRMAAGRYAEAMIQYYQVLAADSTRADVRRKFVLAQRKAEAQRCLAVGLGHFLQGRYDSVRVMLDSALTYDPENPDAAMFTGRVDTLPPQGGAGEGLQKDPQAWGRHVEALKRYRAGDYAAAIALWERILARYPGHPEVVANIRQARLRLQAEGRPAPEIAEGAK